MSGRDMDGQVWQGFRRLERQERDIAELLGIAKGILFDGVVSPEEATMLARWCEAHPEVVSSWPGSVVRDRLEQVFEDGVVDAAEQEDLRELLEGLVGGSFSIATGHNAGSQLPLCQPEPKVYIGGCTYLFTGKFAFGPRKACEQEILDRGGFVKPSMSKVVGYVVIGTIGSRDWIQSSYGRKIQRAVELRDSGHNVRIISEDHWIAALG